MNTTKIPAPLCNAAHALFSASLHLPESPPAPEDQAPAREECGMGEAERDALASAVEEVVRAYLRFSANESATALGRFATVGHALADRARRLAPPPPPPPADGLEDAASSTAPLGPVVAADLRRWLETWNIFRRLWRTWTTPDAPVAPSSTDAAEAPVLAADQRAVVETLVALVRARKGQGATLPPVPLLPRWSVPLLVGPGGAGKAFACAEAVRRLGLRGHARWEIGSWNIAAARSGRSTLEQIEWYVATHPDALIYLAGVDALSTAHTGAGDANVTYMTTVAAELENFLDGATGRGPGANEPVRPCVVLGGRFSPLWGEVEVGGVRGADLWKLADAEPLAGAEAVGTWLREHSGLPAGILRRVAAEPLVVRRLDTAEAERVAGELCARLPPALDGALHAPELAAALAGPHGWRALAHRLESTLLTPG